MLLAYIFYIWRDMDQTTRRRLLTGLISVSMSSLVGCTQTFTGSSTSTSEGNSEEKNTLSEVTETTHTPKQSPSETLTPRTTNTPTEATQETLAATNVKFDDRYGCAVDVSDDVLLVGACGYEDDNHAGGGGYIWRRINGNWVQEQLLLPNGSDEADVYGSSVAIDGRTAVLGGRNDENPNGESAGAVVIFRYKPGDEKWVQIQKIAPEDGDVRDLYGSTLALSGDTLLVGSPNRDPGGTNDNWHGAVYRYTRVGSGTKQGWKLTEILTPDSPDDLGKFGSAVSMSDTHAVVGAYKTGTDQGDLSGAAYVYSRDGNQWTFQSELSTPGLDGMDYFGHGAAISEESIIVGAFGDEEPNGKFSGSAYTYSQSESGWSYRSKLAASDAESDDEFGKVVAMKEDIAVIGAPGNTDSNTTRTRSAYLYRKEDREWIERAKLTPDTGNRWFGSAIAIGEDNLFVGAEGTERNEQIGTVYRFNIK